jgi:hypothetical protein
MCNLFGFCRVMKDPEYYHTKYDHMINDGHL